jgi:hypothetical protein
MFAADAECRPLQLLVVREQPLTVQAPQLLQGPVLDLADALTCDARLFGTD